MGAGDIFGLLFLNLIIFAVFWIPGFVILRRRRDQLRRDGEDSTFATPGVSIEVDCRACGQFNRVPSHRLRDRPKCGRCKERLMPGKRLTLTRVSRLEARFSAELDAVWQDEDR